jgi:tRNA threonylcarbamoyladenosine biosynthesis protein TsaB
VKILALELSTTRGSLAWLDGDVDLTREWTNDRKNSAVFFENLNIVAKKFGAPDTIIVGLGPGSYAGTRIAISAAIGLQVSSGARLIGFPSICAIECDAGEYCVIGDARRKSFFFARILANELVEGPALFLESELKPTLDTIELATPIFTSDSVPQFERAELRFSSALVLARLAREPQRSFSWPPLEPIYLREPHITIPKLSILIVAGPKSIGAPCAIMPNSSGNASVPPRCLLW